MSEGQPITSRRAFIRAGIGAATAALAGVGAWQMWPNEHDGYLSAPPAFSKERRKLSSGASANTVGDFPAELSATGFSFAAEWVLQENAKQGTPEWAIEGHAMPGSLDGYCDRASAQQGDVVSLFVSCADSSFSVEAYRMGYYGGYGARLVWTSEVLPGTVQKPATFTPGINMVECEWVPSLKFLVGLDWPEGAYLLKLVAKHGQQRYVPITIRNDKSTSTYVIQNSITTWQAYNGWGGYSQYFGPPHKTFLNRSRVVSYDRPYDSQWGYGSADFLGNEFPLIMLAEKLGLDVTYWTDIDFHTRPSLLNNHSTLISLGHDEYWSPLMFDTALSARNAGVNFIFLGANACFRRIRLDSSPLGANRRQICYKVAAEDPLYGHDDALVTANFPSPPAPQPESMLIGNMYQSNGVHADMLIADTKSWVLQGTGLRRGSRLPSVVGPEYDGYDPRSPGPSNIDVIAHSKVVAFGQNGYSDMTWYSQLGQGGVFSTGTNKWVNLLGANAGYFNLGLVRGPVNGVTEPLTTITCNVLRACVGPAGNVQPSAGNWQRYYPTVPSGPSGSNYRTSWPA